MATTPKRTGSIEEARDAEGRTFYRCRVRLADGTRVRVEIPEAKRFSETASKDFVAWAQAEEERTGEIYSVKLAKIAKAAAAAKAAAPVTVAGETCDAWYQRFMVYRRQEVGSVDDDKWRWMKWVSPLIGAKAVRDVSPDDIEDIREAIDAAILAYEASGSITGSRVRRQASAQVHAPFASTAARCSSKFAPRAALSAELAHIASGKRSPASTPEKGTRRARARRKPR